MQVPAHLQNKVLNDWSVDDVAEMLILNSVPQDKVNIVKGEEIDGIALRELDRPTLKEIGITQFGIQVRIKNIIEFLIDKESKPTTNDNLTQMTSLSIPATQQVYTQPSSAQFSPCQPTFSLTANNSQLYNPAVQPNFNQNPLQLQNTPSLIDNNSNIINTSISSPYLYHQNVNLQQALLQQQPLNDSQLPKLRDSTPTAQISQTQPNVTTPSFNTNIKTELFNPLLESAPQLKQEPVTRDYPLSSEGSQYSNLQNNTVEKPVNPTQEAMEASHDLSVIEVNQVQKELNILIENFHETWLDNIYPSLLKKIKDIYFYCKDKGVQVNRSIDHLLNNMILPIISLLTQSSLKVEEFELLVKKLAQSIGGYRVLIWIMELINTPENILNETLASSNQLLSSSNDSNSVSSYNWSRSNIDELLNMPSIHISQHDYFKRILEECQSRTHDIQLISDDINELIINYLKKKKLYFQIKESLPSTIPNNTLQYSHQALPSSNLTGLPSNSRYSNEARDNFSHTSSDRYETRASLSRGASPEPYRDGYLSTARNRPQSETSEFYEDSRLRHRGQSIERFENQRVTNVSERSSSFNRNSEYDRSASRSSDYNHDSRPSISLYDMNQNRANGSISKQNDIVSNLYHLPTVDSNGLNEGFSNRNSQYSTPTNERVSRPSFSFKEISRTHITTLPKQPVTKNSYKSAAAPTFDPPRKENQLLPPFSNFKNSPISIKSLALDLQPHQVKGVEFLWKTVVEKEHGAILAHAMGLGKTGQVYTFLNTLRYYIRFNFSIIPENLRPFKVLILTPASLQENWMNEFQKWTNFINSAKNQIVHLPIPISLSESPPMQRINRLQDWNNNGGICIISHSLFRSCVQSNDHYEQEFERLLVSEPGASLVVIDEAHVLKEEDSMIRTIAKQFKTPSRIMLTGYPIQNNLTEYWCMSKFVKNNIFDSLQNFNTDYRNPIIKGLYSPSGSPLRKESDKVLYKLSKLLQPIVHRVNSDVIKDQIPKKSEYAICCYLSPIQTALYKAYLELFKNALYEVQFLEKGNLLQVICNMPIHKDLIIKTNTSQEVKDKGEQNLLTKSTGSKNMQNLLKEIEKLSQNSNNLGNNPKFLILTELIQEFLLNDEKMIIFSRNIKTLLAIQKWLELFINQKILLLTGETIMEDRQQYINRINEDSDYKILLASINVGGVGFTVTGATRVVVYDVGYNPTVVDQAIARTFRIGQTKNIHVYRLYTYDTWEARLNSLNEHKNTLILRTLDSKNSDIEGIDLKEMKKYFKVPEYRIEGERSINAEDPLLQKTINKYSDLIASCTIHRDEPSEHEFEITEAEKSLIDHEVEIKKKAILLA